MLNLTSLNEGEAAQVALLSNRGSIRRRLQDLGLVEGTWVQCIQKSPSGDPVAYEIRGAIIALRSEDTNDIFVRRGKSEESR